MKKLVKFSMMICLAALLFACEDEKKSEETPYFGVEAKFLTQTFGPEAGDSYVTVKTNQVFTATSSESWCTTEVLSDKTADNLKISVQALNAVSPRTATVTVACQGFESAVIAVTQTGVTATLSVTPLEPETIAVGGGDVTFTVEANAEWSYTISEDGSWLLQKEKDATSLVLTAEASLETSPRSATVTFSLTDYPNVTEAITISQAEAPQPQLTVTPSATQAIIKGGGDATFTVEANAEWSYTISEDGSWLLQKEKDATSLVLTAGNNTLWGGRSAVVTVSLTNYPEYSASYTVKQSGAADMLDVIFHTDGTAEDISPMAHTVVWKNFDFPLSVTYDATWGRNVATFNPQSNGSSPGVNHGSYYNVDYVSNTEFQNKLADGHTFECVVKFDVNYATAQNYETKFFSTQGAGGTGFLVANQDRANGLTFLPNIPGTQGGGSNWIWTNSQIKPDGASYYHLVGVWNQEEGKAYIYVNGEKKSEAAAAGYYRPMGSNPRSLGIGGDPGDDYRLEGGLQGKIVIARIYDSPLTEAEAQALYNEINP